MQQYSYVEKWSYSAADVSVFGAFGLPDKAAYPAAYRWYVHIAALNGTKSLDLMSSAAPAAPAAKPAAKPAKPSKAPAPKKAPAPAPAPAAAADDDDDMDDMFGDDDEDEKPKEMDENLLKLKAAAEARLAKKEAAQKSMVVIEVKPWEADQDLNALWKKIVTEMTFEGLKWGEACQLVDVAFGIKKIVMSCVIKMDVSMDDVTEAIQGLEDEVQSVDIISMNGERARAACGCVSRAAGILSDCTPSPAQFSERSARGVYAGRRRSSYRF